MRNIGDILRMVVGLRLVGLVLGLTGINSLQNANSTSGYQPKFSQYRKSFKLRLNLRNACERVM